jgi:hypothetical protein
MVLPCVCGAAVILASPVAQAAGPSPAAQLVRAAMSNANAKGSVHETETITTKTYELIFEDDVARDSGAQTFVEKPAGIDTHVLVVNGTAYFDANEFTLHSLYGLSVSAAKEIGARWVSVPKSNSKYAAITGNVTLPSALQAVTPRGHFTETAPTKVNGISAVGIRSKQAGAVYTLYISQSDPALPLALITTGGNGTRGTVTFADWGEPVDVKPLTNALPIAKFTK